MCFSYKHMMHTKANCVLWIMMILIDINDLSLFGNDMTYETPIFYTSPMN